MSNKIIFRKTIDLYYALYYFGEEYSYIRVFSYPETATKKNQTTIKTINNGKML